MKFATVAATAFWASSVSAGLFSTNSVSIYDDNFPVPGENPLKHCQDPAEDVLDVISVDLNPNPPRPGASLDIVATGYLKKDVEDGAKIHLQVKYGLITIVRMTRDLCEDVKNLELECPLKKGELKLAKSVDLPKEIPPGKYTVQADVVSKDEETITCLTAQVEFKRGGADATLVKQDV